MLTEEQKALRRQGITATDVAKIIGCARFGAEIDVWLEKRDQSPPFVESDRVKWGNLLEPIIRQDYGYRTGMEVDSCPSMTHASDSLAIATPDGLARLPGSTQPLHGWECKTHSVWAVRDKYGDEHTEEVPEDYYLQMLW